MLISVRASVRSGMYLGRQTSNPMPDELNSSEAADASCSGPLAVHTDLSRYSYGTSRHNNTLVQRRVLSVHTACLRSALSEIGSWPHWPLSVCTDRHLPTLRGGRGGPPGLGSSRHEERNEEGEESGQEKVAKQSAFFVSQTASCTRKPPYIEMPLTRWRAGGSSRAGRKFCWCCTRCTLVRRVGTL